MAWNLSVFVVSSLTMRALQRILIATSTFSLIMGATLPASGQAQSRTGFEAFLHGSHEALLGRGYRLRGRAYEVLGLADLRALPRATVRARYASEDDDLQPGPWQTFEADALGRFVIDLPIPANARGASRAEVRVGLASDSRLFSVPIELVSPVEIDLRTDRVLYEPGEPAHVWVRLWDRESHTPVTNTSVEAVVSDGSAETTQELVTSSAGVASFSMEIPETAQEGSRTLSVRAGRGSAATNATTSFRIGRRAVDRLSVSLELSPEAVAPEGSVTARVEVRTPSGAPVRGAEVSLIVDGRLHLDVGETNSAGVATTTFEAPAYLESDVSTVGIRGTVTHAAHGSVDISGSLRITRPMSLRIDAIVPHGGLIPEIDDEILISVLDAAGEPPEEGTMIEVSGHAVRGGRARRPVDRYGFASIPTRTPVNAVAVHQGDEANCGDRPATSIDVTVQGPQERSAHLCIPALTEALVAPTVTRPVLSPGEQIEVTIGRRPVVARGQVVVDLMSDAGDILETTLVGAGTNRVTFTAPQNRLGVFVIRARPILDEGAAEGTGAEDAFIIRPPHPSFLRLETDRDVYRIRETARVSLHTDPAGGAGWVALMARDLSMHGGERPFGYFFLRDAFDKAVLDPSTPESARLVRAALAAQATVDPPPAISPPLVDELGSESPEELDISRAAHRGDLRDPLSLGEELRRRGVQPIMVAIEVALKETLEQGTVDELTQGEGAGLRFRSDIVRRVFSTESLPRTLGEGEITMEMLSDVDPSFTFDSVATRVARRRLVRLMGVLASYLDPDETGEERARGAASEPPERWLSRLVQQGLVSPRALHDPWGRTFLLRRTRRTPAVSFAVESAGLELLSPGPDGIVGNGDDVRDPFARAVPPGTPYALASGEDDLMAALSLLTPGEEALSALLEAYRRMSDEALEEALGDFAIAGMSEESLNAVLGRTVRLGNLNTIGHGGGGGSGSGYGRGAGGLRGRRASVPTISGGGGRGALSAIIRERFPATLQFVPEAALDPSGHTIIELELADAVTTYIVEAVVWTREGWLWSGSTTVSVDQEIVVDAPVPAIATVGDRLKLPLRVSTRTQASHHLRLRAEGSKQLALAPVTTDEIEVPGADARDVPVELTFSKRGEGTITVSALARDGQGLDATRRPVKVVSDARRVRHEIEAIVDGSGNLSLEVPASALERGRSEVTVAIGPALFGADSGDERLPWDAWVAAFAEQELSSQRAAVAVRHDIPTSETIGVRPSVVARAIGALWSGDETSDHHMFVALLAAMQGLSERPPESYEEIMGEAELLLLISPAVRQAQERPALRERLMELTSRLRSRVEEGAAFFSDAPWLWAQAATALLWSQPRHAEEERAQELLRRARRSLIAVGDDQWLEGGAEDQGEQLIRATALLALCEVRLGDRQQAFRLVSTIARMATVDGGGLVEARAVNSMGWAMARAAADTLVQGRPVTALTLRVDDEEREVELVHGASTIEVPELGRAGQHHVEVDGPPGAVALLRLHAEYGLPWDVQPAPSDRGPLDISIEGDIGVRDGRSELRLVVRNVVPRLVSTPIVEVDLPAGAEVDVQASQRIAAGSARAPEFSGRTLTLTLNPLCPGAEVTVALPIRWTAAGHLRGLGAVGYAADRPSAVSILPSREVVIHNARQGSESARGEQP